MNKNLFLLFLVFPLSVFSQDVIVKKDGSSILAKVLEVDTEILKYKKWKNLNGPIYSIKKADLFAVNYENGEKDTFGDNKLDENVTNNSASPLYVEKVSDAYNDKLISRYNQILNVEEQKKNGKQAKNALLVYGVGRESVMSNEDLEIQFERGIVEWPNSNSKVVHPLFGECYYITLKNKTNKTIYVDLGNCFKIFKDGTYHCFYNPQQTSTTVGGGTGGGLALGGVANALGIGSGVGQLLSGFSVGGGSTHSISKSYVMQRVIAIPSLGKAKLTENKFLKAKKTRGYNYGEYEQVESAEKFNYVDLRNNLNKGLKRGETIYYEENNTPYSRKYVITYSKTDKFEEYSTMDILVYLRQIVGVPFMENVEERNKYIKDFNKMNVIAGFTNL